jgi:hypothetical protein
MSKTKKIAYALLIGILAGIAVVIFFGLKDVFAEDLSTWRYGSPGDFRRWANERSQRRQQPIIVNQGGYRNGQAPVIIYDDDQGEADAAYMDMIFRSNTPELYRQTMPQAPQVNININNGPQYHNGTQYTRDGQPVPEYICNGQGCQSNDPQMILDRTPQKKVTYWKPKYPAAFKP